MHLALISVQKTSHTISSNQSYHIARLETKLTGTIADCSHYFKDCGFWLRPNKLCYSPSELINWSQKQNL